MAALLLNHRQGVGDTPAQPSPLAIPAKAEPVTPPPPLTPTARELIENIQALTDALALLQARLEYALTPPQSEAGQSTNSGRPLDTSRTWRLSARQFTLIAPGRLAVELIR
ncbi:MAG: hypothetical protein PW786_01895, partial [Arachidicoccus sp.]|nr:hypothetical protein [Arachidicoccus sp.]